MTIKFKVGDRVTPSIYKDIFEIVEIKSIKLFYIRDFQGRKTLEYQNNFELVERKIDDKWYKAEELENMKEEFEIDKLGWYERRDGEKVKIIHFLQNNNNWPALGLEYVTCKDVENFTRYNSKGKVGFCNFIEDRADDLIKYLGPELPKEPRVFEFEAEVQGYNVHGGKSGRDLTGIRLDFEVKQPFPIDMEEVSGNFMITLKELIENE